MNPPMEDTKIQERSFCESADEKTSLVESSSKDLIEQPNIFSGDILKGTSQVLAAQIDNSSIQIFIHQDGSEEETAADVAAEQEEVQQINEEITIDQSEYTVLLESKELDNFQNEQNDKDNFVWQKQQFLNETPTKDDLEKGDFESSTTYLPESHQNKEDTKLAVAGINEGSIQLSGPAAPESIMFQCSEIEENYIYLMKSRQSLMREAVEWKVYAKMLLEKGVCEGSNFVEPEILSVLKETSDVALKAEILARITERDMLQPPVQFWDFEKIYVQHGRGRIIKCPNCAAAMLFLPFRLRFALRMLYDLDKPVLLVTSFLRCINKGKKQHEILGYDPRLLRMFPDLDLPFMLFHKAGITKRMMDFIMESVLGGMTINRLFDVIRTKYEVNHTVMSQFFANEIDSIREHIEMSGGHIEISNEALFPPYVNCHPSKALLSRCFLASFKERDEYYKHCMRQLLANECIILDDTLRMSSGLRGAGSRGATSDNVDFTGLFLVFNEQKHIITWTFLNSHTFSEVHDCILEVASRHNDNNCSLKACFTARCCEWREHLRAVFGKWFIVKGNLRLFLDDIIKELPQTHPSYHDCITELVMVFRQPNDTEDVRKDYTPDPTAISLKLQEFMKRWKDVVDDNIESMLTLAAVERLIALDNHVQAGCLSAIPPQVGEDNFSATHMALQKAFAHNNVAIQRVSALFTMCLHNVNRARGASFEGVRQHSDVFEEKQVDFHTEDAVAVSIQTDVTSHNLSTTHLEKQQVLPAADIILAINNFYKEKGESISTLLLQALMYYKYAEDFDALAPQCIKNLRLLPYYSSAVNLLSHPAFPLEPFELDRDKIVRALAGVQARIRRLQVDVEGNGSLDDAFHVVARQLTNDTIRDNLAVEPLEYVRHLLDIGVQVIDQKESDLTLTLQNLVNYQDYLIQFNSVTSNISTDNITHEQEKDEIMASDETSITDQPNQAARFFELLKKLSDKLGAVITVFTDLEYCWVVPVFPTTFHPMSPHLFAVYRHCRLFPARLTTKSYASVMSVRNINLKRQGKEPQCRCGRGTKGANNGEKCVTRTKYTSRCVCFRLDRACGEACDCHNCANPFGCKPEKAASSQGGKGKKKSRVPNRARYAHEAARVATCKSSRNTSIATQTTQVEGDTWVALEHSIFEALINEDTSEANNLITSQDAMCRFNEVVRLLTIVPALKHVAREKTSDEITQKLHQREVDVAEYLTCYQMQVDLSLGGAGS